MNKPKQSIACQVQSIENLGADVFQLDLLLPKDDLPTFAPGQYLMLASSQDEFYPFSIASAPQQLPLLSLQILARENAAVDLLAQIRSDGVAQLQLPLGDVCLRDGGEPLLLIAAGTGMAQMHSMLEYCRLQGSQRQISLYWGAKTEEDFYQVPAWQHWQQMENVSLHRIVSHDDDWDGRSGLLYEAVCQDIKDFSALEVYVSGSPNMVYATLDAFVAAGMQQKQMHADVFSYAPRN